LLIQSIHYEFASADANIAETLFRELRDDSLEEEGIFAFEVARSKERPNVFVLWEVYRDQAALDHHLTTKHFERLAMNGIRPIAKERIGETAFPI